jgi:uncharacterized protein (TIGR03790 family)
MNARRLRICAGGLHPARRASRVIAFALPPLLAAILSAQSGRNVLVIVNEASPVSRRIGEYYTQKRSIPLANVCGIRTTTDEEIAWETYVNEIEKPVARCLKTTRFEAPILILVTTLGVPLKIRGGGSQMLAEYAAVDSELTLLYEKLRSRPFTRAGAIRNPFYGKKGKRFKHPDFPMYLVTRLAAYDFEDVKNMIDRSLAAKNVGTVVLDARSDSERPGDSWLRDAAVFLPAGRALFDESSVAVTRQSNVIGYGSWGSNDPQRKRDPAFRYLPGAIVNEYVSTNGRTFRRPPDTWQLGTWKDGATWFAGAPQSLSADYIRQGATGASGHVYEPFLEFCPRPELLFPAYLSGRTLAESFYLAMPGLSWQNIILGDPLCRLQ